MEVIQENPVIYSNLIKAYLFTSAKIKQGGEDKMPHSIQSLSLRHLASSHAHTLISQANSKKKIQRRVFASSVTNTSCLRRAFVRNTGFLRRVLVDEGEEVGDAGVDTGEVRPGAAVAPRNDTDKSLGGIDERAARVALARVLSTRGLTGADHVGGDGLGGVQRLAGGARDNGHADLEERAGDTATLASSAPTSNGNGGSRSGVAARGGEASVGNVTTSGDGSGQLPDGDVVVVAVGVVVGVDVDGRDGGGAAARGGSLFEDRLVWFLFCIFCFLRAQ